MAQQDEPNIELKCAKVCTSYETKKMASELGIKNVFIFFIKATNFRVLFSV